MRQLKAKFLVVEFFRQREQSGKSGYVDSWVQQQFFLYLSTNIKVDLTLKKISLLFTCSKHYSLANQKSFLCAVITEIK